MFDCPICLITQAPSLMYTHSGTNGSKHPFCKPCLSHLIRASSEPTCPICRKPLPFKGNISLKERLALTPQEVKIYLKAAMILGTSGAIFGGLLGAAVATQSNDISLEDGVFHGAVYCGLSGIYTILLSIAYRD